MKPSQNLPVLTFYRTRWAWFGAVSALTLPALQAGQESPRIPRVAGVVTVYHENSHADVIVGRVLAGHTLDDQGDRPQLQLASLYTDQVPENDLSRGLAKKYGFPIFETVSDALTLGTGQLAVDGVLLVAEHGRYPKSALGQIQYPKRRLFEQIVKVFEDSGRVVPVFVDKHLADTWEDAKWIYDTAQRMKIPLMAGSSLPVLWRYPPLDIQPDRPLEQIVAVSYHTLDAYGFHALEAVQALVEHRKGGETGIRAVQCLENEAVWEAGEQGVYDPQLFEAAFSRVVSRPHKGDPREIVENPVLWVVDYQDGLRACILTLNYAVTQWAAAWRYQADPQIYSTLFWTQEARPFMHFTYLVKGIEKMIHTGIPTWPVERTLLTSGTLDALLQSKSQNGQRLETPHLAFPYQTHWKWHQPPPSPLPRPSFPRFEFTRMVAHWGRYADPAYLSFLEEAQPEVVQLGFYGAHFWSLAHTSSYSGYPAHFPVRGLTECGDWFEEKNRAVHELGAKVVGHFNIEFLVGDLDGPDGPTGFFKFYRDLWDEEQLGPKPVEDPVDLLEKNADGTPIGQKGYGIGGMYEYWACLRNPHWKQVLKAWVRQGIRRGVDGFMINYFYRHNCLCKYCQAGFRAYLRRRFTPDELRQRFGIEDLDRHQFDELVCWHDPAETTPLRLEMLRFSQISNKQTFDEVFVRYGRSLKENLIVGQWNHLGNFGQISGDERCLLPPEMWGQDETYLWYSTGASANYTDLENHILGEGTLQARYIRGAFDDKPFTLGKYESTRIRAAIAELAANGGAPMGFYTNFTDPEARREIVRYYQFLKRYEPLFHANRSYAEAVLLYPRSRVHQGQVEPVETFRQMGRTLLEAHVLFDVLPDDLATPDLLARYPHVYTTDAPPEVPPRSWDRLSRFEAPFTVRVSASRPEQGDELTLHFVNYNREEPPKRDDGTPNPGGGIKDEKPLPIAGIRTDLIVPAGFRVSGVEAVSPEQPDPAALEFELTDGRLVFTMPEFLVYGVARVHLEPVQ